MSAAQIDAYNATCALAALGHRPLGDAPALRALANHLDHLSTKASTFSFAMANVPSTMTFEGPAGSRYKLNASHVGTAGSRASQAIESAASSARTDADKVEAAQDHWDKAHHAFSLALKDANKRIADEAKVTNA